MKLTLLILPLLASTTMLAATVKLDCARTSEGDMVDEKTLAVELTAEKIQFHMNFFGKNKLVSGNFEKISKNGSRVYDGSDLTDLVDQADMGNIFVDEKLLKGQPGSMGFSVRQLGDSEGFAWISEQFKCHAK